MSALINFELVILDHPTIKKTNRIYNMLFKINGVLSKPVSGYGILVNYELDNSFRTMHVDLPEETE